VKVHVSSSVFNLADLYSLGMREDSFPSAVSVAVNTLANMSATLCSSVMDIYQAQLSLVANVPASLFSSVTDAYEAQLSVLANVPATLCSSVMDAYQAQLSLVANVPASLFSSVTDAYEAQLSLLANLPAAWLSEALSVIADETKLREIRNSAARTREHHKISHREYAAWLTVITFLVVYISCAGQLSIACALLKFQRLMGLRRLTLQWPWGLSYFGRG
jgi:hypothetical protein